MPASPTFGFTLPPALDVNLQVSLAAFVERMGFDRLWLPDHLGYPDWSQAPCAWSLLTAMAMRTRRITLGTAVSDPHRVPPAVFAQRAATLDQISRGRVIIGLGTGEAMNVAPFGIAWDRRLARLKDTVAITRALLDTRGPVHYDGALHSIPGGALSVRPYKERRIPIYLAALGPKAQQLCGEVCDGWLPVVIPPEHFAHYHAPIIDAARAAGRDPSCIDRVANIPVALVDDEKASRMLVVASARRYALTLVWPPVLEQMGMPLDSPPEFGDASYITVNPADPESMARYRGLQRWIPEDVVMKFVYYGTMPRLKRIVGDYLDAGATSVTLVNVSPDPLESTVRLATELVPAFRGGRAPLLARLARTALPLLKRVMPVPSAERSVSATAGS